MDIVDIIVVEIIAAQLRRIVVEIIVVADCPRVVRADHPWRIFSGLASYRSDMLLVINSIFKG